MAKKIVGDSNKNYNYGDLQITSSKLTNLHLGQHPPDDTELPDNDQTEKVELPSTNSLAYLHPTDPNEKVNGYFQEARYLAKSQKLQDTLRGYAKTGFHVLYVKDNENENKRQRKCIFCGGKQR